jgi:hypothetical protein
MQANIELGPTATKPARFHAVDLKDIPAIKRYALGQLVSSERPYVLVSIVREPAYFVTFDSSYVPTRKVERTYDKSFNVVEAPKKVTKNA